MTASLDHTRLSRRRTLSGAAIAGVGVPLLVACGDDDGGGEDTAAEPTPTSEETPSEEAPTEEAPTSEAPAANALAATADVPEGGGVVLKAEELVVTQPTAGEFKCFAAVCTHQGCVVGGVDGGTINCPCHGSKFSIADGSVANGPASSPLEQVAIQVQGDSIVRA
ncbi:MULTISPECIES: Rieske (2Fe-2S) protein [unclassified Nocardioides]|uniref:Rieske (2Fe-2S) protein n=1 Tax=unclassified Nocardioides TaxID=2615069 RepID=UPI003611EFEE